MTCPHCSSANALRPGYDGDLECYVCGAVVYREVPLPLVQARRADGTVKQRAREFGKWS